MICLLPEGVVVIPEDLFTSSTNGVIVKATSIKDPFVTADELCGKSDSVMLVQRACSI